MNLLSIHSLFAEADKRKLRKGECLYQRQDIPKYVFRVTGGRIKSWQYGLNTARSLTYHIYEYADIFGYLEPLMSMTQRRTAAVAIDYKTFVQYLPIKEFMSAVQQHYSLQLGLLEFLTRDTDSVYQRWVLRQDNHIIKEKILLLLKSLAEERGTPSEEGIRLPPTSHQELANYIGVSRQDVSTAVKALERAGYLHYNRKHILVMHSVWKDSLH